MTIRILSSPSERLKIAQSLGGKAGQDTSSAQASKSSSSDR